MKSSESIHADVFGINNLRMNGGPGSGNFGHSGRPGEIGGSGEGGGGGESGNKKTTEVNTFATRNDTDKWVVIVDGKFGLFASKEEAERAYNSIPGGECSDSLANIPFHSADILPPNHTPKYQAGYEPPQGISKISEHQPIDIKNYIKTTLEKGSAYSRKKEWDRLANPPTKQQIWQEEKAVKDFFGWK